jgi:hypothetical protein
LGFIPVAHATGIFRKFRTARVLALIGERGTDLA